MKTFEEFSVMTLRPAHYNGTVFEIDVEFKEASLFEAGIDVVKAIGMTGGDTVRISGRILSDESECEFVSVYMCGDVLSDFINKYGVRKINASVRMKLELIYAVYENRDFVVDPKNEEITAYRLIELIGE